jgi:hypothetical protein
MSITNFKTKILDFITTQNFNSSPDSNYSNPKLWPDTFFTILKTEIDSYAKIKAKFNGNVTKLTELQTHKNNGTIPDSLQVKFKKLYTKDTEVEIRAAMISATIDSEISNLNNKNTEFNALFENRGDSTLAKFQQLNNYGFTMDSMYIMPILNQFIAEKLIQFTYKSKLDAEKRQKKKELYLSKKEKETTIATVTNKQLSQMKNTIKTLQSQVISLKTNQGKVKRLNSKVQSSTVKQKKEEKKGKGKTNGKNNGSKQNSRNTKRSHGKNGK